MIARNRLLDFRSAAERPNTCFVFLSALGRVQLQEALFPSITANGGGGWGVSSRYHLVRVGKAEPRLNENLFPCVRGQV